ncbi:hypothetical protein M378DRAFT_131254 [Amanita muscaria Koide BX008]|uniref:Uncharacterized protein n=1 Tax=Amanita muscaria (strain Koide BX008) TaxID=946122 RepID=A0A0C2SAB4_AMAMK|nr:hypothetical protein M378DRAFT_131254 [Amanita muscaria Koide BX008]
MKGSAVIDTHDLERLHPIPTPRHRHATPSGPWPFLDLLDAVPEETIEPRPQSGKCRHNNEVIQCKACLEGYPQSLFPNWTMSQQQKSLIAGINQTDHRCTLISVELATKQDGQPFSTALRINVDQKCYELALTTLREMLTRTVKVRAIFVDGISGCTLKMLGTLYDIEPFFWSSSLGWTPSRFQESLDPVTKSDHITLTLRFVRKIPKPQQPSRNHGRRTSNSQDPIIDVHKPLVLDRSALQPDLLAFHMIRSQTTSTIISYHSSEKYGSTTADELCERLQLVGRSVYWAKIFEANPDPTFVVVSMLWYCVYAWDEATQELYAEICRLEAVIMKTLELTSITNHLHAISAHLLYYISLLADFRKAVCFVRDTPNPAVKDVYQTEDMDNAMKVECDHLLHQISRIEKDCKMQELRLANMMNLGYSRLNIYDSKQTTHLTEASLRDSKAMKQIAYLTMVFLPATFTTAVFSMNVDEINPGSAPHLWHYFVTALPLTLFTMWLVGVMQLPFIAEQKSAIEGTGEQRKTVNPYKWSRLWWPIILLKTSLTDEAENKRLRGLEYQ